jgi:hypothetical protein
MCRINNCSFNWYTKKKAQNERIKELEAFLGNVKDELKIMDNTDKMSDELNNISLHRPF